MRTLINLLVYSLIGYSLYELYQIISQRSARARLGEQQPQEMPARPSSEDVAKATQTDTGRMMNITGTGRGTTESTLDPSGTSVPHQVGRGVIQ